MFQYTVKLGRNIELATAIHHALMEKASSDIESSSVTVAIVGDEVYISNYNGDQVTKILKMGSQTQVTFEDRVGHNENVVMYPSDDFNSYIRDIIFFFNVTKGK